MALIRDISNYEIKEKIGKGAFGSVFRADIFEKDGSTTTVAVKIVNLEEAEDEMEDIQKEISMLANCDCDQLTKYYGSLIEGNELLIAMELMDGGSVGDLIDLTGICLDEASIGYVVKKLCIGLAYLHSERKIHRDIKAKNILISNSGEIKLADFGVAAQLTDTMTKRATFVGSPYWMAPEVIQGEERYNESADIWSVGITVIELAKGKPPYSELNPYKALFQIPSAKSSPTLEGDYSTHIKTFVSLCLQKTPTERASPSQLLNSKFLKSVSVVTPQILDMLQRRKEILAKTDKSKETSHVNKQPSLDLDQTLPRHGHGFQSSQPVEKKGTSQNPCGSSTGGGEDSWDFTLDNRPELPSSTVEKTEEIISTADKISLNLSPPDQAPKSTFQTLNGNLKPPLDVESVATIIDDGKPLFSPVRSQDKKPSPRAHIKSSSKSYSGDWNNMRVAKENGLATPLQSLSLDTSSPWSPKGTRPSVPTPYYTPKMELEGSPGFMSPRNVPNLSSDAIGDRQQERFQGSPVTNFSKSVPSEQSLNEKSDLYLGILEPAILGVEAFVDSNGDAKMRSAVEHLKRSFELVDAASPGGKLTEILLTALGLLEEEEDDES